MAHGGDRWPTIVEDDSDADEVCDNWLRNHINACEYLNKHGLNQAGLKDIIIRAEWIKAIKTKLDKGETMPVSKIPADITHEDIFGEPLDRWNKKYQALVNAVTKSINSCKAIGMKNGQFAKREPVAWDNVQKAMVLMKELVKTWDQIVAMAKNMWQPPPSIIQSKENFQPLPHEEKDMTHKLAFQLVMSDDFAKKSGW